MNNKGFTLVELMVSVSLISIVLVFMFSLLGDIKRESAYSNDNINDTLNRSTIIRIIQNDFIEKRLNRVETCREDGVIICYSFTFEDGLNKKLYVREKELEYDNEIWKLGDGKYSTEGEKYCYINNGDNYLLKIVIPVINHKEDNRIHDIELIKMGMTSFTASGSESC